MEKIILLNIISEGFRIKFLGINFDIFYILYVVLYIYMILLGIYQHKLKKNYIFYMFLLFLTVIQSKNSNIVILCLKQLIPIIIILEVNNFFISKKDILKVYNLYIKYALFCSIIGIIQFCGMKLNIEFLYNYDKFIPNFKVTQGINGFRINSIFSEPAALVEILTPLLYISIRNLLFREKNFINKKTSLLVLTTIFFTDSSLGILSIFFTIIILLKEKIKFNLTNVLKITMSVLLLAILTKSIYLNSQNFKMRVDDTLKSVNASKLNPDKVNLSTYALLTNLNIMKLSLIENKALGIGIGAYQTAYDKHISKVAEKSENYGLVILNREDGNSMLIRLLTEIGVFGVSIIFIIFYKNLVKLNRMTSFNDTEYKLYIVNRSIVILFILKFLRSGNYLVNGFLIFVTIYYLSFKKFQEESLRYKNK